MKALTTKGCKYLESNVASEDDGHTSRSELVHLVFPKLSLLKLSEQEIDGMEISRNSKFSLKLLAKFMKDHDIPDLSSRKGFKVSKVFSKLSN